MTTSGAALKPFVDLANCNQELIHLPGKIQPHGMLLALDELNLTMVQVSENVSAHLKVEAKNLIGQPLESLFSKNQAAELRERLRSLKPKTLNPMKIVASVGGADRYFNGIAHRNDGFLILELEPTLSKDELPFIGFYHQIRDAIATFRNAKDLNELCQNAVNEIRRMTGFDRAVIYQFDPEWNGKVIAEDVRSDVDSLMGLHFPSSDIPKPARDLYVINWFRIIPTVDYTPSELVPHYPPGKNRPLDLTFSVLRSVSPIHLEYLRNMRATASMSISLLKGNQLWGLISCTHEHGPLYLPYEIRTACEFLGEIMSSLLVTKEGNEQYDYKLKLNSIHSSLLQYMTQEPDFVCGLVDHRPNLTDLVNAQGAAVYFHGKTTVVGQAPNDDQIKALIEWLSNQEDQELFVTDSLPSLYPAALEFKEVACGLLAASMSRNQNNYVLWFRPEVIQTVNWGGNPTKPLETDALSGELRLHPRKSFELWKETVKLKSIRWEEAERQAAADLRKSIIDIVLQKSEELSKLNIELERSNVELDSFAYAASHDLKEPLRGIHNYTNLVMRELGSEHMIGESQQRLATIVNLTQRMESLIDSLLHYSQVGRMELSMRDTNLGEVVTQVTEMLKLRLDESETEVRIPRPLPTIRCDRVRVSEVFSNLITNAIKYNDKPKKWVELGYLDRVNHQPIVFYVRDNGIGIREKNFDTIFKIFRRLHKKTGFGGGAGTGLTITKRIIERHNGKIWLESQPDQGTVFYFTLEGEGDVLRENS